MRSSSFTIIYRPSLIKYSINFSIQRDLSAVTGHLKEDINQPDKEEEKARLAEDTESFLDILTVMLLKGGL